ncbi:hypothetical protein C8R41DRAFT_915988 [Lentinula lateritia]|uniref:Uncharacterized protein n=1 Tax=Lentinula lateritia TaxID=40482 RepID=A0ABQ8VWI3_9AGAR|nr:hypothetical protein C8R41DRAFT_915988 [Lentinula lateritia]
MSLHRHLPSGRASGRLAQTRHSSQIAEGYLSDNSFSSTAPPSTSNLDEAAVAVEAEQTIQKFILALKPGPPLDPDEIWSMYVNIEKANALSRLAVQQLLVFTDKEAFINELMNIPERPWASPSYGKPSAHELVYGPLLKGYTTLHKAEDVQRLHNDYSAAGGVETLGTLSALFDVYRRTYQIENVKEMWPAIFALGVEYVKETPVINSSKNGPSANRLLNNILCLPLSIYIDALSAAGEHEEIARVWKTFQEHGFSFDSQNWNHLAVTLIRAGQLERAFQVVEHVILPYQDQARDLIASRNSTPNSPLMYSLEDLDKDEEEFNTTSIESQAQLKKRASWRLPSIRRNKRHAMPQLEEGEEAHADDLAYPIHVLHQISHAWNVWKIHIAVKRVFLRAIEDLREGYLPRPFGPRRGQLPHSQDFMDDNQETSAEAKELFRQLYDQYPRTYSLLHEFEIKEKRRLGRSFGRKYEYGDYLSVNGLHFYMMAYHNLDERNRTRRHFDQCGPQM